MADTSACDTRRTKMATVDGDSRHNVDRADRVDWVECEVDGALSNYTNCPADCRCPFRSSEMLRIFNFTRRVSCTSLNAQRVRRSHHRKEFIIQSDFFDTHPIDRPTIDALTKLDSERKSKANIGIVQDLYAKYEKETDEQRKNELSIKLRNEFKKFPNQTHPTVLAYGPDADNTEVESHGDAFNTKNPTGKDYVTLCNILYAVRLEQLGNFTGPRSYYFMNGIAELVSNNIDLDQNVNSIRISLSNSQEQALIRYTIDFLTKENFNLISVPDILPAEVIEGCGMQMGSDEKTQVFRIQPSNRCLSGTSEMAMGGFFSGKTLKAVDLPKKVMAVSRCYRAESGDKTQDKNLYRVHCFTKVEMFAVCLPTQSEQMLEHFRDIECRLFKSLGISFKVYDMPIRDLGAPAYRKYDIEAWMPSRKGFGEISSTSNCTDYQSKRLNIFAENENGEKVHAHTVNGTACAIPRMIIALLEQYQVSGLDVRAFAGKNIISSPTNNCRLLDRSLFQKYFSPI